MTKENAVATKETTEQLPEWMGSYAALDQQEELKTSSSASRVMIIKSNCTNLELKDEFGEGSAVLMPDEILLADKKNSMVVVPILAWTQYEEWPPYKGGDDDNKGPSRVEMAHDGELARKAMEQVRAGGKPETGNSFYSVYTMIAEITAADGSTHTGVIALKSGNWKEGNTLFGKINRMKKAGVPVFLQRYKFSIENARAKGNWFYRFDIESAKPDKITNKDEAERLSKLHAEAASSYQQFAAAEKNPD